MDSPTQAAGSSDQHNHQHPRFQDPMPPGKKRVGFTSDSGSPQSASQSPEDTNNAVAGESSTPPVPIRRDVSHEELSQQIHKAFGQPYLPRPRPAIRRISRTPPQIHIDDVVEEDTDKRRSGIEAHKRASRLAKSVGTYSASAPGSRRNSQDRLIGGLTPPIELRNMSAAEYESSVGESADEDEDTPEGAQRQYLARADHLLRQHTVRHAPMTRDADFYQFQATPLQSGQVTPVNEVEMDAEHVPRPPKFRTGVLGTILRASSAAQSAALGGGRHTKATSHGRNLSTGSVSFSGASTAANSINASPERSGTATPDTVSRSPNSSTASISRLIQSSSMLATPAQKDFSHEMEEIYKKSRPSLGKRQKSNNSLFSKMGKSNRDEQIKIKIHLAGTLARQNYLRRLCKALMMYGAPTHRLEEYMNMSARVLEIEAQFLYMPGCMIIAFDDSSVHTSEVKLVRTSQGVDLGKLRDTHEIYKEVIHDRLGVEEATRRLEAILKRKVKFNPWLRVLVYGLASAMVGPFAFQARPIDLPFCFTLGSILGWLQLIWVPRNEMISNVFEIGAAVITSFVARGLGSIRGSDGKEIFCFSAMAQSSIALILPGFTVLSASLELQSKHIVAGSVRMVYALIYSLFLGFGITIGTVLFGLASKNPTSATTCRDPMSSHWNYPFVAGFSLCLMVINQAKYKQIPAMLVISLIGYVVNFHTSQYFTGNAQVSNTLGAFAIGLFANLHARFGRHIENWSLDIWENNLRPQWVKYRKRWLRRSHGPRTQNWSAVRTSDYSSQSNSRSHSRSSSVASEPYVPHTRKIGYGLAAATMLPAIFVQVPSGLSVSGSLVSGIMSADQITRNSTGVTTVTSGNDTSSNGSVNTVALNVGFSVIQVAIGITVGLFLAALAVYPFGKRRSGLFSF